MSLPPVTVLALLPLLGAVAACDAPPRDREPAQPAAPERAVAAPVSKQEADERSARCAMMSREQFQRAWQDGSADPADGRTTAEFANHYNTQSNTCFYLLTVSSDRALKKMLFDLDGGELYGEYLGPAKTESPAAGLPKTCRVESLYCASGREWEVLVAPYMEE